MPELRCLPVVKKLLRAGISYKGDSLINYLVSQDSAPSWDVALVWNPKVRAKYWQAMVELQKELVPQHISLQDLYSKLWELLREVVLNKAAFQSAVNLQKKINDFSTEVKKPLKTFDIIYEIKNLDVGSKHFNLGGVEIFKLTSDYLQGLLLNGETSSMRTHAVEEWTGRSVAKVEVDASEIDRVYESGIIKVNSILDVIRLAAVRERIGRLHDEMFLWELDESITIPRVKPKKGTLLSISYQRGSRPLIVDMGNIITKGLESEKAWKYILDGKLPEDINRRLIRAIEWISHGITSDSLDYKLVNLCTALEILLLPNHKEGTKGELIALRQVLVGQNVYCEPAGILSLYEQRCNIIHSGYLNITSYSDYWHLLHCCLDVLRKIVYLSQRYSHINELEALLGIVENKETLETFIEHCEQGLHKGREIGEIKKAAKKLLERYQQ